MGKSKSYLLTFLIIAVLGNTAISFSQEQKLLWFGDTGNGGKYLDSIHNLIRLTNPDYVIHTGDIQHSVGQWDSLTMNIYNPFKDVTKNFPNKPNLTSVQKLFVAEGNHDRMTNLDRPFRYALPEINLLMGNKNYYSKKFKDIDIFFQDTNDSSFETNIKYIGEPDGNRIGSRQYNNFVSWAQNSNAKWKIVLGHHPEILSLKPEYMNQYSILRWDFGERGIVATLRGHSHVGEVLIDSVGFPHFINGIGTFALNNPALTPKRKESIWLNYSIPGACKITEYNDSLTFSYINFSGKQIFKYVLLHPKSIKVTASFEGFVGSDTVNAYLANSNFPYEILHYSQTVFRQGSGVLYFPDVSFGKSYYLILKQRNSIETWSGYVMKFNPNHFIEYDFTKAQTQAAGNNLVLSNGKWSIYAGDVNQDGIIDSSDLIAIQNGYARYDRRTDLNNDGITNSTDMTFAKKNSSGFILKIMP